ncbi:MAG: EamA family transporter [Pseudomonadota bacterium]
MHSVESTSSRFTRESLSRAASRTPPHVWFVIAALFHYLGPAFAVLLFPSVGVLGVAWLRIASAAAILGPITKPWRAISSAKGPDLALLLALGACLGAMNCAFYLALDRLPMSLVAAIEFVGVIAVALVGLRSWRNYLALLVAIAGVVLLIDVTWSNDPAGLAWALGNGVLFVVYIVLGHRAAQNGPGQGIGRLGAAMMIAFVVVTPLAIAEAIHVFGAPILIAAGIGVGICSSVIPYVCDQLAMARLPRASFALMLSILPAMAAMVGAVILAQRPSTSDLAGIGLVMAGVALHRPSPATDR